MLARLLLVAFAAFVMLNGLVLAIAHGTGLGSAPSDIQTRGIYEVRLSQLHARVGESVAVIGDSVVFGGHLAEKHGAKWPTLALPGQLELELAKREHTTVSVLNLGINGLLFRELTCVVRDVLEHKPDALFINVSPRAFAADFASDEGGSARPFLCPRADFAGKAESALRSVVPALRYRDLWQFEWLSTTPRALARDQISKLFVAPPEPAQPKAAHAADDEDEDDDAYVASLLWRFKAAQRLNSIDVRRDHPQAEELDALLTLIREANETRVVLFYLHEDEDALAGQLEVERFHAQRARFADWVKAGLGRSEHARFVQLSASDFRGQYVDHVHLTATGYEALAQRLSQTLPKREPKRAAAH